MTLGFWAMLIGTFIVPAILLWAGHRLRKRSPRWIAAFWGAIAGHLISLVVGSIAAMMPAAEWAPTDFWRGAFGYWSFLVLPVIGAGIGLLRARRATSLQPASLA